MSLIYGPSTELIQLNRKWKRSQDSDGFKIDMRNGKWLRQAELDDEEIKDNAKDVKLFATDTADTLYIQPLKDLDVDNDQIVSLSFALKRAIENIFQVEENEVNVIPMGNEEAPNIMIYESSEGSLGILSQLVRQPRLIKRIFKEAYEILNFDSESLEERSPTKPIATYDDLLSYYNQPYHDQLDRYSIKETLEKLMDCEVEDSHGNKDRETHYQYLLDNYDENSQMEERLIKYLYKNGYALPDKTQRNLKNLYISVDFIYETQSGPVLIFCDGSVHDTDEIKAEDNRKREWLTEKGYDYVIWHYKEPIEDLIKRRKDIFRKIY